MPATPDTPRSTPPVWKRRVRRLAAVIGGVGAASVGLAVALALAISAGWHREELRRWVEALASDRAGIPVRLGGLEGPLYPELTLRDLRLGPPEAPALAMERAHLRIVMARWLPTPEPEVELAAVSGLRLRLVQDPSGRLTLALRAAPSGEEPTASERGAPRVLPVHALRIEDGTLRLERPGADEAGPKTIHFRLDARAPAGLPLALPLEGVDAELEARLEPAHLGRGQIEDATLQGTLSAAGTLRLQARGAGTLDGAPAQAALAGDLHLTTSHLEALPWRLENASGSGAGLRFEAHGQGSGAEIERLDVEAREVDLAWVAGWLEPGPALAGRARLQARLAGSAFAPELELSAEADALEVDGRHLGRFELTARSIGPRRYRLERLALAGGELPLLLSAPAEAEIAEGRLHLEPTTFLLFEQPVSIRGALASDRIQGLEIRASSFEIGPVLPLAGLPGDALEGRIDLVAQLQGPLSRPDVRLEQARLALQSPSLGVLASALAPDLRWSGSARLEAELEGPLEHLSGPIRIEARDLAIEPQQLGTLVLRGTVSSGDSLQLEQLELAGGDVALALVAPARIERRPEGLSTEDLQLVVNQQPVRFHGGFERGSWRAAHLETRDLALRDVAALAALRWPVAGRLSLALDLEGPLATPRVRGDATWLGAAVGAAQIGDVAIELASQPEGIGAHARAVLDGRELLVGEAFVPLRSWSEGFQAALEDPRARLTVYGESLDLAALGPFLPRLVREPAGRVAVDLRLSGGRPAPTLAGHVDLQEASLEVPVLGQRFAPIEGRVALTAQELHIERLQIGAVEAGAALTGRVMLDDLRPTAGDLRLTLTRFPLARSAALSTDVSGVLQLHGATAAPRIEGELRLSDLRASLAAEDDPALREVRIVAGAEAGTEAPDDDGSALLEPATLDVKLEIPRNSWVRGRGAEVEIEGRLELRKDPGGAPQTLGTLQVVRGSYRFRGRRFDIRRGIATFDGGSEPDPLLDLVAAYRVRDVTVLAMITGRVSEPQLRLASEPDLPESDVLAYLVFGRPARDVGAGEQADLQATAVTAAAGIAASQLSQLIAQRLPIDTVDLRVDETGAPAELEVGKYLTDNLFLRYGKGLGAEADDEVHVELRLGDGWGVESEITRSGAAGADLVWTWEY